MRNLETASQERRNNLDFLRFLFAALVIVDHSLLLVPGPRISFCGWLAVNGFFIISGFLITASWLKTKSTWDYFRKRILRIYPAYIVVSLIGTLVLGYFGAPNFSQFLHSISLPRFLLKLLVFLTPADYTQLTAFRNQPFPHTINLSLWTISYEFFCYCAVVVLGIAGLYKKRVWMLSLFLLVYGLTALQATMFPSFWTTHLLMGHSLEKLNQLPRLLTYYATGMVFYFYRDTILLRRRWFYGAAILTLVGLVSQIGVWLLPIPIAYVIFYLAFSSRLKAQNFSKYGDFSYGVYLYGWPIQKLLVLWFPLAWHSFSLAAITLILACGCAVLSWHLVEKPCLKLKKRPARSLALASAQEAS